jgi:hypothetical protein
MQLNSTTYSSRRGRGCRLYGYTGFDVLIWRHGEHNVNPCVLLVEARVDLCIDHRRTLGPRA